jgi:bis(5'-nucleosyl)-tetraphosphatase (symmetrical)
MVHAGIAPEWSLSDGVRCAGEVVAAVRGPDVQAYLGAMYGHEPVRFTETLAGTTRLRVITNVLTRSRYLRADGSMDLDTKCHPNEAPAGLVPWYDFPDRQLAGSRVLFGHWASLNGDVSRPDIEALDTGCVWGGQLTALCLETGMRTACDCNASSERPRS